MGIIRSKKSDWKLYGSDDPRFLISGHSHTFSIYAALQNSTKHSKNFGIATQHNFKNPKKIDLSYWKFVVSQATDKTVLIFWNGNQHNIHFLLDTYEPFNVFKIYEKDSFSPVISLNQLKALFAPTFLELSEVIQLFPDTKNLALVQTPAPKAKAFIESKIQSVEFFLKLASEKKLKIDELEASSDTIRVGLWNLNNQLLNEISVKFDLPLIPIPADTIDKNGLLKEIFYTDDLTHANELYGLKMLEHLSGYLEITNG